MTIGERIKIRREELGLTQEELAKMIGYSSKSSINKIELNVQNLTQSKIKAIADALQTTPSYIMGWEGEQKRNSYKSVQIPVLGRVAAGEPIYDEGNIIGYTEISEEWSRRGDFFGLIIEGNSMEPRIYNGDTVIVRQQSDAETGDIVIASVNGDSGTCKRLVKHRKGIELQPLNPKYEPFVFTNKEIIELPVSVLGKVVEVRSRL